MDNSQAQDARGKQTNSNQQSFQQRARTLIHDRACDEYAHLIRLLNECVEERNAKSGDSPKFVMVGAASVQLGHMVLLLEFDQQFANPDKYVLVLKVGLSPSRLPLFGTGPTPHKNRLLATPSHDLNSIVWADNLGQLTSAELVEFALGLLASYYRKHKRN
jgi:hypothetical protein